MGKARRALIQAHLDEAVNRKLPDGCGDMIGYVVLLHCAACILQGAGSQRSLKLSRVHMQTTAVEQNIADPFMFITKLDRIPTTCYTRPKSTKSRQFMHFHT